MLDKIKKIFTKEIKVYTFLFAVFSLTGWTANGLYKMTFSMSDLIMIFVVIVANATGLHFIDSKYNSPIGISPINNNGGKNNDK